VAIKHSPGCICCGCIIFDIDPENQEESESIAQLAEWDEDYGDALFFDSDVLASGYFTLPSGAIIQSTNAILPTEYYRILITFYQFGSNANASPPQFRFTMEPLEVDEYYGDTEGLMSFTNEYSATTYITDPNDYVEDPAEFDVTAWDKADKNHRAKLFSHVPSTSTALDEIVSHYSERKHTFEIVVFDDTVQIESHALAYGPEFDVDSGNVRTYSLTRKRYIKKRCRLKFENLSGAEIKVRRIVAERLSPPDKDRCDNRDKLNDPNVRNAPLAVDSVFNSGLPASVFFSGGLAEARMSPYPTNQEFTPPDLTYEEDASELIEATECSGFDVFYYRKERRNVLGSFLFEPTIDHYHAVIVDPLYEDGDDLVLSVQLTYTYFSRTNPTLTFSSDTWLNQFDPFRSRRFGYRDVAAFGRPIGYYWAVLTGGTSIPSGYQEGACSLEIGGIPAPNYFGVDMPTSSEAGVSPDAVSTVFEAPTYQIPQYPPQFEWTADNPVRALPFPAGAEWEARLDPASNIEDLFAYLFESHTITATWTIRIPKWHPGEFPGFTIPVDAEVDDIIGDIQILSVPTVTSPPPKVIGYSFEYDGVDTATQTYEVTDAWVGSLVVTHRGGFYNEEL
jgi:hypothetical protein